LPKAAKKPAYNPLIYTQLGGRTSPSSEGKITLKTHAVSLKKNISMSPDELKAIREKLRLSQAVFADYLHTGVTTYQNWEQGRAKPNKQALILIRMVEKDPMTLDTLAAL
jgi:putative transcriptional regulator